jgi:hypothetical protein
LGKALKEMGYFDGRSPKVVHLSTRGGVWVVRWYLRSRVFDDVKRLSILRNWLSLQLAATAFPDEPVELCLCDESRQVRVAIPVEFGGKLSLGQEGDVYYKGALRAEAESFAAFLRNNLEGKGERVFILSRRGPAWVVTPLHQGADSLIPERSRGLQAVAREYSLHVFGGDAVQIELLDEAYRPKRTITMFGDDASPNGNR